MRYLFLFVMLTLFVACKPDPSFLNSDGHDHQHVDLNVPPGLPTMSIPADNPLTVDGIALGRKLFYENLLSANNTQNCGSCHQLGNYFVDSNKQYSVGIDGIAGTRNSMPLFNVGYAKNFFWDGSSPTLEAQVITPITSPIEMHETMENVVSKLQAHPEYPSLFKKAFGSEVITSLAITRAIAQFERTIISANSKFDKWKRGQASLTPQELRGMEVYISEEKGDCFHCHSFGGTFTDFGFKNTGLDSVPVDKGLALVTKLKRDEGKFKTPTLRNIAFTAPYMHDGRFTSLRQCIQHYNKHFKYTENLAPELKTVVKDRMTEADVDDLIAFLETLTDYEFVLNKAYDKP
jgi:cytochrome c peroxidase